MKSLSFVSGPAIGLALACVSASSWAGGAFVVLEEVVRTGHPIPGSAQTVDLPAVGPTLMHNGAVCFTALSRPFANGGVMGNNTDIFSLGAPDQTPFRRLIRDLQATPANDGRLAVFDVCSIDDSGIAHVSARLDNVTQFGSEAIYRVGLSGELVEVLRSGKAMGAGLPALCQTNAFDDRDLRWQRNGDLLVNLRTDEGVCQTRAIYRIGAGGTVTPIVRLGDPVLGTAGTLSDISSVMSVTDLLSDGLGSAFFRARDTANGSNTSWYLLRSNGVQRVAPIGNGGNFASINGTLTRHNTTTDTIEQFIDGNPTPVVRMAVNQTLPDGPGRFLDFPYVDVNLHGQIVALANLSGTPGGNNDDYGLYLADGQGVVKIVRIGEPALVPGSTFTGLTQGTTGADIFPTIGGKGKVLFGAEYRVGTETRRGVFYYDRSNGLREILNRTTVIAGTTVRAWYFTSAINENDEAVFNVRLEDENYLTMMLRFEDSLFDWGFDTP